MKLETMINTFSGVRLCWKGNNMFEEMVNHSPDFGYAQQMRSNMSPWGDILFVIVVVATLAVLVGATVWGVKHSE